MKKIAVFFPKDSEAFFNKNSKRTFGGATVQMYLIASELSKYQEAIETISIIPGYDEIDYDETEYFNLANVYKENDNMIVKMIKCICFLLKSKPDIVIQHGLTTASCFLAFFCYIFKIKFIFMVAHDVEVKGLLQYNQKKCPIFYMILFSYLIIAQNKYQFDDLRKKNWYFKKKTFLMYNGFPVKNHTPKTGSKILWVARSDKWKRPELFIELAKRNINYEFIMICPCSGDFEFYDEIKEKALAVENLEFIEFVPFSEINECFELANIFVNTSDFEGYPQTFIQAAMHAVPILSLKVNPDGFISSNNCGYVFNGDFEAMVESIGCMLRNKDEYEILSKNVYSYYLQKHNIERNVDLLLGLAECDKKKRNVRAKSSVGLYSEVYEK